MRKSKGLVIMLWLTGLLLAAGCGGADDDSAGTGIPGGLDGNAGEAGSAAGGEHSGGESSGGDVSESVDVLSWRVSHTPLDGAYELADIREGRVYGCSYTGEGLTVSVQDVGAGTEGGTGESGEGFTSGSCQIPGVTEIWNMMVDARGRVCLFGRAEEVNTLWRVEANGEIETVGDIEVEGLDEMSVSKGFFADSQGYYYLWYGMTVPCSEVYEDSEEHPNFVGGQPVYTALDRIYVMDGDMNTVCYEQVPDSLGNQLISLLFDEDGTPMLLAKDREGCYTRRVRTEEREEYEPVRLEGMDEDVLWEIGAGGNLALTREGLLYTKDGALYLYRLDEGRKEKLLELAEGGIFENDIIYLGMQDGIIEIIDNYRGSGEYARFEKGESNQLTVSLGVMTMEQEIRNAVTGFNRYQDRVRIVPVVYVEEYDYDSGYERLKLDVIRGKAPDLICTEGIDFDILANTGAFADLYEFMEKDQECGREVFLPSVLEAYETGEHLYKIAPAFSLYTMWGGGSLVQGRRGVGMEELIGLLEEKGGSINSIYGLGGDESVLRTLCSQAMGEYIDWEEGVCDFTGEFGHLLEFAKEYRGTPIESLYGAIRNGEILLTLGRIGSVEDYRLESELYGEKVQCIGYPTSGGTGTSIQHLGSALAVNAKAAHPEEAWEFLRYYLLQGYHGSGFPMVKEQFDKMLAESMEDTIAESEDGSGAVMKIFYSEWQNDVSIMVPHADQEDVDAVRELVESAEGRFEYYNTIQSIIDEEAESYFQGQKTLEEVLKLIQNRVQLYLDENR